MCAVSIVCAAENQFETDEKLEQNARGWAEEFVDFAANQYQIELDFSEVSIKYIDEMVDDLHQTFLEEQPPDEQIVPLARALGCYIAEVYRIRKGGRWGWVNLEDGSFPGVEATSGATFLPMAKALNRIKTGEDPDIWAYFQMILNW